MPDRRSIPPLKALATLECVVRHSSVSRAAEELCVTHGAVSKQLTTLAAWIGHPLFADNRRRMVPTPVGRQLANGVATGMRAIYQVLDEVRECAPEVPHLRVIAPATLTIYWLVPRLPSLRRSGLNLKAQVRHTHTDETWQDQPFDLVIRADHDAPADYESSPMFRDLLGLVAAPEIARMIRAPADLVQFTLLESETRPGELDTWLSAAGLVRTQAAGVEAFEHNYISIEAAVAGLGAVVAPLAVVGGHLDRGSLVTILPEIVVPGPEFTALHDPRSNSAKHARAFANWLQHVALEDQVPATAVTVAARSA
ncbi:MAG: LysR substrate-binding domain-containing protein [Pseudomonadota bacterium]